MADSRIPELIADLEAQAVACLLSIAPVDRDMATQISKQLAQHLTNNWRGQIIYFPKNHGGTLDERDKQIYAEFNGKNHQQLAKNTIWRCNKFTKLSKRSGRWN